MADLYEIILLKDSDNHLKLSIVNFPVRQVMITDHLPVRAGNFLR